MTDATTTAGDSSILYGTGYCPNPDCGHTIKIEVAKRDSHHVNTAFLAEQGIDFDDGCPGCGTDTPHTFDLNEDSYEIIEERLDAALDTISPLFGFTEALDEELDQELFNAFGSIDELRALCRKQQDGN